MERPDRDDRDHDEHDLMAWAPVLLAILFVVMAVMIAIAALPTNAFRPKVGDFVRFQPGSRDPATWHVTVRAIRIVAGTEAQSCVLDTQVMLTHGGSLIVEARHDTPPPTYRVHWAGTRSDSGGQDCGTDADLLLPMVDLRKLATAAGGFGAGPRRIIP